MMQRKPLGQWTQLDHARMCMEAEAHSRLQVMATEMQKAAGDVLSLAVNLFFVQTRSKDRMKELAAVLRMKG